LALEVLAQHLIQLKEQMVLILFFLLLLQLVAVAVVQRVLFHPPFKMAVQAVLAVVVHLMR
jgi:hypothetical protein